MSVPGCGLASDVGERWFAEWRGIDRTASRPGGSAGPASSPPFDPDVVIALFGAQDAFDRRIDGTEVRFDGADGSLLAERDLTEALATALVDRRRGHAAHHAVLRPRLAPTVEVERSPLNERWIDRYNLLHGRRRGAARPTVCELST